MDSEVLNEIREEISGLSDRLLDLSMEELRAAIDRGETTRPETERAIIRARGALERAVAALDRALRVEE